jgi:hypothetical protein
MKTTIGILLEGVGTVKVEDSSGNTRILQTGDAISEGDIISTSSGGGAVVKFDNGFQMMMASNETALIDESVYQLEFFEDTEVLLDEEVVALLDEDEPSIDEVDDIAMLDDISLMEDTAYGEEAGLEAAQSLLGDIPQVNIQNDNQISSDTVNQDSEVKPTASFESTIVDKVDPQFFESEETPLEAALEDPEPVVQEDPEPVVQEDLEPIVQVDTPQATPEPIFVASPIVPPIPPVPPISQPDPEPEVEIVEAPEIYFTDSTILANTTINETPTIMGSAEVGSEIRMYDQGELIESFQISAGTDLPEISIDGDSVVRNFYYTPEALEEGLHSITLDVLLADGTVTPMSDALGFTYDTLAPDSPIVDNIIGNESIVVQSATTEVALSGNAEAQSTVSFYHEETLLGEVLSDENGEWSFSVDTGEEGLYSIDISVRDSAGNSSSELTRIELNIDLSAPDAPIIHDIGVIDTENITISGTAEANSLVTLYNEDEVLGIAQSDEEGRWEIEFESLSESEYSLVATATDSANNVSDTSQVVIATVIEQLSNELPTVEDMHVEFFDNEGVFTLDSVTHDLEDDTYSDKLTQVRIDSLPNTGILYDSDGNEVNSGDVFESSMQFHYSADQSINNTVLLGSRGEEGSQDDWGSVDNGGFTFSDENGHEILISGSREGENAEVHFDWDNLENHQGVGLGVAGGDNTQIETKENLVFDFSSEVSSATIGLAGVGGHFVEGADNKPDARVQYEAYLDGELVVKGEFRQDSQNEDSDQNLNTVTFEIEENFDQLVFMTDANKESNYSVKFIEADFAQNSESFTFSALDSDGNSSAQSASVLLTQWNNEAPNVENYALDASQGEQNFTLSTLISDEKDDQNSEANTQIRIDSLPVAGTLYDSNGNEVNSGDIFDASMQFQYMAGLSTQHILQLGSQESSGSANDWGEESEGTFTFSDVGGNEVVISGSRQGHAADVNFDWDNLGSHDGVGIGVKGGDKAQIETKESLTFDFSNDVTHATIGLAGVGGNFVEGASNKPDARAHYEAYLDGELVEEGDLRQDTENVDADNNLNTIEFEIDSSFNQLVFTTDANRESNYSVKFIEAEYTQSEDTFTFAAIDSDGEVSHNQGVVTITLPEVEVIDSPLADMDNAFDLDEIPDLAEIEFDGLDRDFQELDYEAFLELSEGEDTLLITGDEALDQNVTLDADIWERELDVDGQGVTFESDDNSYDVYTSTAGGDELQLMIDQSVIVLLEN